MNGRHDRKGYKSASRSIKLEGQEKRAVFLGKVSKAPGEDTNDADLG
jgi:hypothetical protein